MATWKEKYNKKYQYKKNKSHNLSDISKDTGVSRSGLQKIYNKGIGAYKTNPQSVRPNVTSKEQWAMARVYSSVMGGKASKIDKKELNMEKGGSTDFNPDGKIKDKVVHASGDAGGMLVGKRHSNGGIKALNKSTGQPLEMEGGEVVITRNAVSDNKKRSFNGKMLTNRQILSEINESGGGVSFADGGKVPNNVKFDCNAEYEYGGKTMCGKDLAYALGGDVYAKGGEVYDETDYFADEQIISTKKTNISNLDTRLKPFYQNKKRYKVNVKKVNGIEKVEVYQKNFDEWRLFKTYIPTSNYAKGGKVEDDEWKSIVSKFLNEFYGDYEDDTWEDYVDSDSVESIQTKYKKTSGRYDREVSFEEAYQTFKSSLTPKELKSIEVSFDEGEYADAEEHDEDKNWNSITIRKVGTYAKGGLIPNVGTVDDFMLKELLMKNKKVLAILSDKEIAFMKLDNVDVIGVSGKNYDFIFTDGKKEFEIINQDRKLKHSLRDARPKIVEFYSKRYAKGGTIECGSCDWSWDEKDGGDDMYVCHKCGTDNTNEYKNGGITIKNNNMKKNNLIKPKRKGKNIMTLAKEIRKKDESWQDALKRAKIEMNKTSSKKSSNIDSELGKLKELIKEDEILKEYNYSKKNTKKSNTRLQKGGDVMSLGIANADAVYNKGGEIEDEMQYGSWYVEIEEDENDEEIRNQEVSRLIREGYLSGFDPTWSLEITNIDGDIDEATENEIARLVEEGYTSGEVVMYKYAKGGETQGGKFADGGRVANYKDSVELYYNDGRKDSTSGVSTKHDKFLLVSENRLDEIKSTDNYSDGFWQYPNKDIPPVPVLVLQKNERSNDLYAVPLKNYEAKDVMEFGGNYVGEYFLGAIGLFDRRNLSGTDADDISSYNQGTPRYAKGGKTQGGKFADGGTIGEYPRVYIADLEAYNNGELKGEWLDLADYNDSEEFNDAVQDLLDGWGVEEYAIHDVENFPDGMYSEYMGTSDFDEIYDMIELAKNNDLPLDVVMEVVSQYDESAVEEYQGQYEDGEDFASQMIDEIGLENFSDPQYFVDISDMDRRIMAQEMADSYTDDIAYEDDGERVVEEAGLDVDEYRELDGEDDDKRDEILEEAKEIVRDEYYETWYDGLDDPYDFLVNEQGIYSDEDFFKANFIQIDYGELANALEQDYLFIENDKGLFVFNVR